MNKEGYTKRLVVKAEVARKLYEMIGFPSMRDNKTIIQMNRIKNCSLTVEGIKICKNVFEPIIGALKGKSVLVLLLFQKLLVVANFFPPQYGLFIFLTQDIRCQIKKTCW